MMRSVLVVLVIGGVLGFGLAQLWGRWVGGGAAVLLMLIAGMILVLRRNQADLRELGLGKAPEGTEDVLGEERE